MVEFTSHRKEVSDAVKKAFDIGMEAVAAAGEANAIAEVTRLVYDTPPSPTYVRTGNLRNSIKGKYVREEQAAYVGTNLEYAPYVEYGTRNMIEKPFLRNAAQNYSSQYKQLLDDALRELS